MIDEDAETINDFNESCKNNEDRLQAKSKYYEDFSKRLEADNEQLTTENLKLKYLAYVQGYKKCIKCNFSCISTIISMQSGSFSASNKPEYCANGCGPMWHVTERDERKEITNSFEELFDKNKDTEAANTLLAAKVKELEGERDITVELLDGGSFTYCLEWLTTNRSEE